MSNKAMNKKEQARATKQAVTLLTAAQTLRFYGRNEEADQLEFLGNNIYVGNLQPTHDFEGNPLRPSR